MQALREGFAAKVIDRPFRGEERGWRARRLVVSWHR